MYFEAETAEEAIAILKKESPFDIVYLDHDLGNTVYAPSDEKSGFFVAQFITEMPSDKLPKRVIVHSHNPIGARNMVHQLEHVVTVCHRPFSVIQ